MEKCRELEFRMLNDGKQTKPIYYQSKCSLHTNLRKVRTNTTERALVSCGAGLEQRELSENCAEEAVERREGGRTRGGRTALRVSGRSAGDSGGEQRGNGEQRVAQAEEPAAHTARAHDPEFARREPLARLKHRRPHSTLLAATATLTTAQSTTALHSTFEFSDIWNGEITSIS